MDNEIDIAQYIKNQKQSFAEAFPNISFQEESWGFYFEWDNSAHFLSNIAMIISEPDNQVTEILKWVKKDPERKIAMQNGIENQFYSLQKQFELVIFHREFTKISSPILSGVGIRQQSYRTLDKDMNLQDSINVFTDIEKIPESKQKEFHRFIGGHLHLFEGVLWTLDNDGSVLSAALTSELEDIKNTKFIDLLTTREKVRNLGHGKALLQSILAYNKKINFITVVKKTEGASKLLRSFNFKEIMTFSIYQ